MSVLDNITKRIPGLKKTPDHFWELAREQVRFLYNVALRYAGNPYDAEDLVQETYFIAFKKFDQLRDERKLKSWLFAILRNTYLKSLRQNQRQKITEYNDGIEYEYMTALEDAADKIDVATAYEQKIEADRVQRLLAELPEKYKSALLLYYISEMSYQEISETLDLPMGTVMSRLSRGKRMLKKKILRLQLLDSQPSKVIPFPRKKHTGRR